LSPVLPRVVLVSKWTLCSELHLGRMDILEPLTIYTNCRDTEGKKVVNYCH
jgi:hypothetical protein